jgi:hypothetical protein
MTAGQAFNDAMWIIGALSVWRWWRAKHPKTTTSDNNNRDYEDEKEAS